MISQKRKAETLPTTGNNQQTHKLQVIECFLFDLIFHVFRSFVRLVLIHLRKVV